MERYISEQSLEPFVDDPLRLLQTYSLSYGNYVTDPEFTVEEDKKIAETKSKENRFDFYFEQDNLPSNIKSELELNEIDGKYNCTLSKWELELLDTKEPVEIKRLGYSSLFIQSVEIP